MNLKFQHTKVLVTDKTLKYVRLYKKELLKRITKVLHVNNIQYIISHGNLIEYTRGEPILHDDDIDIRFNNKDFNKWEKYCLTLIEKNGKYYDYKNSLIYDGRAIDFDRQKNNGIQIILYIENIVNINNEDLKILKECPDKKLIDNIHIDLVVCNAISSFWSNQCNVFNEPLRKITYLEVPNVSIPSVKMTKKILIKDYGDDYIIPLIKSKRVSSNEYIIEPGY